jgi:hypothetical protein
MGVYYQFVTVQDLSGLMGGARCSGISQVTRIFVALEPVDPLLSFNGPAPGYGRQSISNGELPGCPPAQEVV